MPGAAPRDYVLTLEQMVIQGVLPAELATAAARSFGAAAWWDSTGGKRWAIKVKCSCSCFLPPDIGWDGSHLVSEGAFLELFVPVAPEEPSG